ncbi:MAG: PD40 domain-containing protein [Acidimicrobiia bacterium]|nr:PD40 domain-containing protein [Acidimicrobiia bacterium]
MRRVIMLATAVVMAMAAPAAADPLEGDWILLHFQDQPGAVYDLYLVHPDGTGLVNLTNGVADDHVGAVSPDGSLIAVSSNDGTSTEIWVMDTAGGGRQRLTSSGGYGVAWTPDGRIVYSRATEIRVMAADGTGDALVVEGLAGVAHNLAVSPDGSTVAFDVQVETDRDIYSVPLAGGEVTELTTEGGFEPEWSPDGSQIVFTTFRASGGNFWVMNPDGSDQHNLFPSEFNDFEASWSPDGSRIVFESVRNEDFAISIFDLTAGTSVDVVTRPTAATFRSPVWVRITSTMAPPVTGTSAGTATTTAAPVTSAVPAGDGEESSIDPIWVALFGAIVAAAAIGIVLARQSGKGKEPPPPPAAPDN